MIVDKILDGLTALIEFLAKAVVFLLKTLGLWIPAVYSIVFLIVCAIFRISFVDEILFIYLLGLAITVLIGFLVAGLGAINRHKRRFIDKEKSTRAKSKMNVSQLRQEKGNKEDDRQKTITEDSARNDLTIDSDIVVPPTRDEVDEKPMIFKTRLDPSILIYEYSDKLVFYRKTENGLKYIRTEKK